MNPNEFLELFENEIIYNINNNLPELSMYYKFAKKDGLYVWRKNYLLQRLEYVYSNIVLRAEENMNVWDVGCGYGTTCIFLALNGIKSIGTTLENYHKVIPNRKQYWQNYGNMELFEVRVENIYEAEYLDNHFDYILVQDTLHHLEPIDQALQILRKVLKSDGKIIVVDDNGNNIMQRIKLFLYRGNKRVINFYDVNLKKHILFGNENVRSLKQWHKIFDGSGLNISGVEYIRFFPPYFVSEKNSLKLTKLENIIWRKSKIIKECFYWGLNFTANKQ